MAEVVSQPAKSTKEGILESALHLFAQRGYDGTSTRDIANAAGVNHALIKYHFGGKEALWRSAVESLFAQLETVVEKLEPELAATKDPIERFRIVTRQYIRYCAEHPEHARIMVLESDAENPRLAWIVEHITRSSLNDSLLNDLMECGAIPRVSPISLRYCYVAMCQNLFSLAAEAQSLYGVDVYHEAQIEAHVETVLRLFLR